MKRARISRPVEQQSTTSIPGVILASPAYVLFQSGTQIQVTHCGETTCLLDAGFSEVLATASRTQMAIAVCSQLVLLTPEGILRHTLDSDIACMGSNENSVAVATDCGTVCVYTREGSKRLCGPGTHSVGTLCVTESGNVIGSRGLDVVEIGVTHDLIITMLDRIVALAANGAQVCIATERAVIIVESGHITRSIMLMDVVSVALFSGHVVCARRSIPTRVTVFGSSPTYSFSIAAGTNLVALPDTCFLSGSNAVVALVGAPVMGCMCTYYCTDPITRTKLENVAAILRGSFDGDTIRWAARGFQFEAQLDGIPVDLLYTLMCDDRRGGMQVTFALTPGGEADFTSAVNQVGWKSKCGV